MFIFQGFNHYVKCKTNDCKTNNNTALIWKYFTKE